MADAEPITVTFTADTGDLVSGTNAASDALDNFSDSAKSAQFSIRAAAGDSRSFFMAAVELKVAMTSVEAVLKATGMSAKEVNAIFGELNIVMDVAISLMAIYRAAKVAVALAHWVAARAALADAAAEAGAASLGALIPVVMGIGLAAFAAISSAQMAGLAQGGIVTRPTRALIGEAGPEAVIPLRGPGMFGAIQMTMNVYSNDPDMISRELGRRMQQLQVAGAF